MHITCDMAMDLAGLYKDGLASRDSVLAIEQHLKVCPACRRYYKQAAPAENISLPNDENLPVELEWKDVSKRLGRHRLLTRLATGAVVTAGFGCMLIGLAAVLKRGNK